MNRLNCPALLTFLLLGTAFLLGCDSSSKSSGPQRDIGIVSLSIDFGTDRDAELIDVVCSPDSTVLSTLERAQNMNKLKVKFRGSGETAFVTSIGGVDNEGADGSNWIFKVNDELGDKSAGIFEVSPGDKISWSFGEPPVELN